MPKHISYHVLWSPEERAYVLHNPDGVQVLLQNDDAWRNAFTNIPSFAFTSHTGAHYTIRKEKAQRGDNYWYAYKSLGGHTSKRYIGRLEKLTPAKLEQVVASFAGPDGIVVGPEQAVQADAPVADNVLTSQLVPSTQLTPMLDTKLHPPRLPAFPVERSRLFMPLEQSLGLKMTLICAPAGFGKTTLIWQWLNTCHAQTPKAWVSLDSGDNDPVRFWRYIIAACQQLSPMLGKGALLELARTPLVPFSSPSLETIVTTLLNELAHLRGESLLVLDDYQVITEMSIHETFASFLQHLPACLHVVVLTRGEPPLPLTRWRAKGEIAELSTSDLRFSRAETVDFLRQTLPYAYSEEVLNALETHLEGWAAGLRLLTFVLRGKRTAQEAEQHIFGLTGEQHSFQDYFVNEIFASQPEPIQSLLLHTSMLSRLSSSLCTSLTQREEIGKLLHTLALSGLFLEELDATEGNERWYRYYPLFAEAMQAEARSRLGEEVLLQLSRQASLWFEQHRMPIESVETALQTHDMKRVAELIEGLVQSSHPVQSDEYFIVYEYHTLCRWLAQLPREVLRQYPLLCFSYANALLFTFVIDEIPFSEEMMQRIIECLDLAQEGWERVGNMAQLGEVLAYRAMLTRQYGDIHGAVKLAQQALTYLPEASVMWRAISYSTLGFHLYLSGQLDAAREFFQPRQSAIKPPPRRSFTRPGIITYSRICREQVALHQAEAYLQPILAEAREDEDRDDISDALLELAHLSFAWNRLDEAEQQAQEALTLGSQLRVEETRIYSTLLLVDISLARGETVDALRQVSGLLASIQPDRTPLHARLYRQTLAIQALVQLKAGHLLAVEHWLQARSKSDVSFPPIYMDIEELINARLFLVQGQYKEVHMHLFEKVNEAQQAGRVDAMLRMKLLMAQAFIGQKQVNEAKKVLQEILLQVSHEGYLRLFLDAGEELVPLLRTLLPDLKGDLQQRFTRELLSLLTRGNGSAPASTLNEPLSSQERRVLHLLAIGHSNPEIAEDMVISINTVKTHVQSIYRKLNVNNRIEASEVARQLKLA